MSTKSRFYNAMLEFFESGTQERLDVMAPVFFNEDFLGRIVNVTDIWGTRITGAAPPTVGIKAGLGNGVCENKLTATSEAQLAGLDWADQRSLVLNQGLVAEFKFRFTTLPTGVVVACLGLSGNHN